MKKIVAYLVLLGLVTTGCATKTGTGALVGTGLGSGVGAIVGGGKGALIGGAVGALSGGLVGAALDEQDRKIMNNSSPRTVERMDRGEPITISDVIRLSQGGVSDQTIINYIKKTGTTYELTQAQIDRLKKGGVSQRLINFMVDSGR
jgi:outer membrane lipoprotein SlyB